MADKRAEELAILVATPVENLLLELRQAGFHHKRPSQVVTSKQQLKLLEHLKEKKRAEQWSRSSARVKTKAENSKRSYTRKKSPNLTVEDSARKHHRPRSAAMADAFGKAKHEEQNRLDQLKQQKQEKEGELLLELEADFLETLKKDHFPLSEKEVNQVSAKFIRNWFKGRTQVRPLPNNEQIEAIAALNGNVQVVARAGSGKTATIINRTYFLIEHCGVKPDHMIILAFNRRAVHELKQRMLILLSDHGDSTINAVIDESSDIDRAATRLNVDLPHILTFHSLAYSIEHPEEDVIFDDTNNESMTLSRVVQDLIDDHLKSQEFSGLVRRVMTRHFKGELEAVLAGKFLASKEELLEYRRSIPFETLRNEQVKSHGEKVIANFLFEHNVDYRYEQNFWWSGFNYRPDFTIYTGDNEGVIIEYFGLKGDPDYDKQIEQKRGFWSEQPNWDLVEILPINIVEANHDELISASLRDRDVEVLRLSEDEIWARIKTRAIGRFTSVTTAFIGRARKAMLDSTQLKKLVAQESHQDDGSRFLELMVVIYSAYLQKLKATGQLDFDGLLHKACFSVEQGKHSFSRVSRSGNLSELRFIAIDEYQDFSELFHRLTVAICNLNERVKVFAVGDDWQAINGFAGSDLSFFQKFEQIWKKPERKYLTNNFRSGTAIVSASNSLMSGLGKPATPIAREAIVQIAYLDDFVPTLSEQETFPKESISPALARIIFSETEKGNKVQLLLRTQRIPWFTNLSSKLDMYLQGVLGSLPSVVREKVSISTAHAFKGLESSTVVVLDSIERRYPLIHPDWIFNSVFGDSPSKILDEERRLFYVAITRASRNLILVSERARPSPFHQNLGPIGILNLNALLPAVSVSGGRMITRVKNPGSDTTPTYEIKDRLKASGYRWNSVSKVWEKSHDGASFSKNDLLTEPWVHCDLPVLVEILDANESILEKLIVSRGSFSKKG
jgi:DNA helicase IV